MKRWFASLGCLAALAIGSAVGAAGAQDAAAQSADPSVAEQVEALSVEFSKAREKFFEEYQKATTDDERRKLVEEKLPKPETFAPKFLELAQKHADDPAAVDALVWIVSSCRTGKELPAAVEILLDKHLANPKLADACQPLRYSNPALAEKMFRGLIAKNPDRKAQGNATMTLAQLLKEQSELARTFGGNKENEQAKAYAGYYGQEYVDRILALDADQAEKDAEALFEAVIARYADLEHYRGSLGEAAKGELFELRNLAIGKVSPDIEGQDLSGVDLKLSEFRGRVVVLDFWGNW